MDAYDSLESAVAGIDQESGEEDYGEESGERDVRLMDFFDEQCDQGEIDEDDYGEEGELDQLESVSEDVVPQEYESISKSSQGVQMADHSPSTGEKKSNQEEIYYDQRKAEKQKQRKEDLLQELEDLKDNDFHEVESEDDIVEAYYT